MLIAKCKKRLIQSKQKYQTLIKKTEHLVGDLYTWRQIKRWRKMIADIDQALWRIDNDLYGTCERCHGPIASERLLELPHVTLCLSCQRMKERYE